MKKLLVLSLLLMSGCSTMAKLGIICQGVIGVSYGPKQHMVDWALPGSPGDKIGIQMGDELINPYELEGRPGEQKTVVWRHEGKLMEATTRLRCIDDIYNEIEPTGWEELSERTKATK